MIPPMQVNKSMSSLDNFRSVSIPRGIRNRRAVHCVVVSVALLAVGALTVGCAIVVREYALSRAYLPAVCRLINKTHTEDDAECTYCSGSVDKGHDKISQPCFPVSYPCVQLFVDFTTGGGRGGHGILYADTMQASGQNTKCSYSGACHKTREENSRIVEDYVRRFVVDRSFNCFYDTETLDNVIEQKLYTRNDVIHCLLWPTLFIAICGIILLYLELDSRGLIFQRNTAAHSTVDSNRPQS